MPEWLNTTGDTFVDVRGCRPFLLGVTDPFVLGVTDPFMLGSAAPFVLSTTSVARASAVGLEKLEKLEILEHLGRLV